MTLPRSRKWWGRGAILIGVLLLAALRAGLAFDETTAMEQVVHGTVIRAVALGLRHQRGEVRMSLFGTKNGFPDQPDQGLQWGRATLAGDSATFVFAPVPAGRYAVSVFHDENGDGSMQKDFLGRPREGWGVSRDVKARFGPPRFDAAAFDAEGDTLTVHLHLRY